MTGRNVVPRMRRGLDGAVYSRRLPECDSGCGESPPPSVAYGDSSPFRRVLRCAGRKLPMKGEVFVKRTEGFATANKLRWGSGGARSGAEPPPAGEPAGRPKRQNSGTPMYGSRIRRENRRQQVAVGPADRQRRPAFSGRVPENRRPWPLQSMAANGRRENPRKPVGVGPADRQRRPAFSGRVPENRRNQPLQFIAAGFVLCPAAAGGCRPCRPEASACRLSLPDRQRRFV